MGGGTTIVEALALGRRAIGCDLNSLAVFVSRVKTTVLTPSDITAIREWATGKVPVLSYRASLDNAEEVICPNRTRNLEIPRARAIKKFLALALRTCNELPSDEAKEFARCALLNVGQWALNGRKRQTSLMEFRERLRDRTLEMLNASEIFKKRLDDTKMPKMAPDLLHGSSEHLPCSNPFSKGERTNFVVTSPPYPGVHILYHRWQVNGRRETPAPYWIANCLDGQGSAYYNFGDRKQQQLEDYFAESLQILRGIRAVMCEGGVIVQMLAFSEPRWQLPRYLKNMTVAGFEEIRTSSKQFRRIWRNVPHRSWHAELHGSTSSSREVVLLHRAS
jgi:hypothetical protein